MIVCPIFCGQRWVPRSCLCQPCSRSAAWAVRFRRCRSARCCRKRGGRQIGDHLEKHFADFGISRPLSGLSALLGMAQILDGFRTHGAASVDVHSGNLTHVGVAASLSPTLCLGSATLCQIGTLLVTFGGQCCISATALRTCGVLYDFNEARPTRNPPSARVRLRLDWFVSADADCNECLKNMRSGKCQKTSDTSSRSHDHTPTRPSKRWPHHDGADLPADGADCGGQGSA